MATKIQTDTKVIAPTITLTDISGAHSIGDCVGGKITFLNCSRYGVLTGQIRGLLVSDLDGNAKNLDLILFSSDPSATTFTDNAALDIADADLTKIVTYIEMTTHKGFTDNSVTYSEDLSRVFETSSDMALYGTLIAREARTETNAASIQIKLKVFQD